MSILIKFLKAQEGLELESYPDSAGHRTIGWGHKIRKWERLPEPIPIEKAEQLLHKDSEEAVNTVNKLVKIPLTEHEQAAVASWVYNLGEPAVKDSRTLAKLNAGDKEGFLEMLQMWNKTTLPNGKKVAVKGLTNRRMKEVALFRGEWGSGQKPH